MDVEGAGREGAERPGDPTMARAVALPVAEAHCKYRKPAYYEDLLEIDITVGELWGASMRFDYVVRRDGETLAEGFTVHACINKAGKIRRVPAPLRALIEGDARD